MDAIYFLKIIKRYFLFSNKDLICQFNINSRSISYKITIKYKYN